MGKFEVVVLANIVAVVLFFVVNEVRHRQRMKAINDEIKRLQDHD